MKIGIVTLQYAHNYGACLQAWALKNTLEKMGNNVEIINCLPPQDYKKYSAKLKRSISFKSCLKQGSIKPYLENLKLRKFAQNQWSERYENFNCFINNNLLKNTNNKFNPDLFDVIVCGSDQVWSRKIIGGINPTYYLGYKTKARKISYAASMGNVPNFSEKEKSEIKKYLNDFKFISVRETQLSDFITSLTNEFKPKVVCDPVFLLQKTEYTSIITKEKLEKEPFIFSFFLTDTMDMRTIVDYLDNKTNTKIIESHWLNNPINKSNNQKNGLSVQDFLWHITNAELIVTNSFHGTALSILFNKEFYSVSPGNERINSLLTQVGLSDRNINKIEETSTLKKINWEDVNFNVNKMRENGLSFLDKAIK